MGLKQSIVVVNQFTTNKTKRGGNSPDKYVLRYMARDDACEVVAPIIHRDIDQYVTRYIARDHATEIAESVYDAAENAYEVTGLGGRGFGYGSVSLGHDQIVAASKDIKKHYDKGHTVYKTIISFDHDYLIKHGLVPEDFVPQDKGDYAGQVDHMKLRMAIMHGLDRMSTKYDDLRYVGTIQTDTMHVHCHLAMFDAGDGNITKHGQQRGVIPQNHFMFLRRGIDASLDEMQHVKHMSSAVAYEKRNVVTYVKKWTFDEMVKSSTPQFLLACLPDEPKMWRARSNAKEMERPNAIARGMVEETLAQPGSPLPDAMTAIRDYANRRAEDEELSIEEWKKLVDTGREEIIEGCINSLYQMLRTIPEYELNVMTPVLNVMSMDVEDLQELYAEQQPDSSTDLVGFGYRMRTYATRQRDHTERAQAHKRTVKAWEAIDATGATDAGSVALHRFFANEQLYEEMLASKYHHLLPFHGDKDDWYEGWDEIATYGERMVRLEMMIADRSLSQLKDAEEAETRGREAYDQPGGRFLTTGSAGKSILRNRLALMRQTYDAKIEAFTDKTHARGLNIEVDDVDVLSRKAQAGVDRVDVAITDDDVYPFVTTRALDLHKIGGDFSQDADLDPDVITTFTTMARTRRALLQDAMTYLVASNQADRLSVLPIEDIDEMNEMADRYDAGLEVLPSKIAELARRESQRRAVRRRATTSELDVNLARSARSSVTASVSRRVRELRERQVQQSREVAVASGQVPEQGAALEQRGPGGRRR